MATTSLALSANSATLSDIGSLSYSLYGVAFVAPATISSPYAYTITAETTSSGLLPNNKKAAYKNVCDSSYVFSSDVCYDVSLGGYFDEYDSSTKETTSFAYVAHLPDSSLPWGQEYITNFYIGSNEGKIATKRSCPGVYLAADEDEKAGPDLDWNLPEGYDGGDYDYYYKFPFKPFQEISPAVGGTSSTSVKSWYFRWDEDSGDIVQSDIASTSLSNWTQTGLYHFGFYAAICGAGGDGSNPALNPTITNKVSLRFYDDDTRTGTPTDYQYWAAAGLGGGSAPTGFFYVNLRELYWKYLDREDDENIYCLRMTVDNRSKGTEAHGYALIAIAKLTKITGGSLSFVIARDVVSYTSKRGDTIGWTSDVQSDGSCICEPILYKNSLGTNYRYDPSMTFDNTSLEVSGTENKDVLRLINTFAVSAPTWRTRIIDNTAGRTQLVNDRTDYDDFPYTTAGRLGMAISTGSWNWEPYIEENPSWSKGLANSMGGRGYRGRSQYGGYYVSSTTLSNLTTGGAASLSAYIALGMGGCGSALGSIRPNGMTTITTEPVTTTGSPDTITMTMQSYSYLGYGCGGTGAGAIVVSGEARARYVSAGTAGGPAGIVIFQP